LGKPRGKAAGGGGVSVLTKKKRVSKGRNALDLTKKRRTRRERGGAKCSFRFKGERGVTKKRSWVHKKGS